MIEVIRNIFGFGPKVDLKELVKNGAQIIDVRTRGEFQGGHIRGSVNLPLQDIHHKLGSIKKNKPVITCCESGIRSGSAKRILKSKGFTEVHNGGGWVRLRNKIS